MRSGTRHTNAPFPAGQTTSTLVILPTFNERGNLQAVIEGIRASLPEAVVLVVDDSSPDGTAALANELAAQAGQIHLLERPSKLGLGRACAAGFRWGLERGFSRLVQMDADLSHDPAGLPQMIAALEHADLVIGSRYVPGGSIKRWSVLRRLLSRFGCAYARRLLDLDVSDPTGGFRAWRSTALAATHCETARSAGYAFQIEMAHRAARMGLRIREIPIVFRERSHGRSKMTWRIALAAAVDVPRMRLEHAGRKCVGSQARRR